MRWVDNEGGITAERTSVELRKFRDGDRPVLSRLSAAAFGESVAEWEDFYDAEKNLSLDPSGIYVIEEDGEARATAAVLPLEAFVDGRPVPMGGISAVATHPAYRRRGYAGELMRAVLDEMLEWDMQVSMLWPFAHTFYRGYGWELAGESIEYTLKPTALPTSPEQKHLRAYREEDLPQIMGMLDRETARHTLGVRRTEKQWRAERFWKDRTAAVYEKDGAVSGYMLYEMSGWREDRTPERTLTVRELVADTPEARAGLLSFMAAQDPLVFEVKYKTPRGEPLHPYLESSYVKAGIEPEFMLRIVGVEGALGLFDRVASEPVVLEVSDDAVPENAGAYTVGDGEVVRGVEAENRVELDVRQLAQLYAGYLSARQLARHGLVRAGSERALELLEELFPAGDPWVFPLNEF